MREFVRLPEAAGIAAADCGCGVNVEREAEPAREAITALIRELAPEMRPFTW